MIEKLGIVSKAIGYFLMVAMPLAADLAQAGSTRLAQTSAMHGHVLSNDSLRSFAVTYSYFMLILASLVFLVIGSIVGVFYPTPKYGPRPYPKWIKLLLSIAGGSLAFIYYISTKKDIGPIILLWVAAVSFVFPAIAHLIHAAAIKAASLRLSVNQSDIDQINKSFDDREE
ncbi:hypothetical protein B9T34_16135 [Acinetobacter sp. ANC 3813]|nr:hypothetical protein B9T34_16135 [Acinetobacter sp. ANC 3813]